MKVKKSMMFLVVGMIVLVIGGLLFNFQSDTNFEGEWEVVRNEGCIAKKMAFYEENILTVTGRSGKNYSGTLTKIGEEKYSFDIKLRTFVLGIKKLSDDMLLLKDANGRECEFKKVD
ncbi:hypothetical protein C1X05_14880 [Laceyella sacchari]|uniref:DUF5640 domain-containing protein n=1 Tax=Laceyella tengchongensis TaxID=574699 RepID=A0AA45WPQ5_9BACL|nr:hypothetical protein [Laceyella tengchongensis]AUS09984.1 hypothetical protein C1X05_14880 [Laceyella sacchari]SMP22303.1 hypothetical protein SAMN06265361_10435 [Laceyella tengchongensis]